MSEPSHDPASPTSIPGWGGISVAGLLDHCLLADPLRSAPSARSLGDYQLYDEIGRGGMGVIYRAQHRRLHRPAAVKLLLAGEFAQPAFIERFKVEAQLLARLRHPHIVSVYEVGEEDGLAYYAMELIHGTPLLPPVPGAVDWKREALFMAQVARAVDYAHEQGVLHRDLKPSNILRTDAGEPRVMDFGLARLLAPAERAEQAQQLTLSREILGSPPYMSPEQARADSKQIGRASDVYSLGGVLYFLLTGRPPFTSASLAQLLTQVAEHPPIAPAQLDPSLPPDLETIALKCLEKEPARRYPTAAALAEELERYTRGEPIHARPLGPWGRLTRWARRRPAWAAMLGGFFTVLVAGIISTTWQWRRAVASYEDQVTARSAEALSRVNLERNSYAADMRAASLAILEHQQPEIGRQLLAPHRAYAERGPEWSLLWYHARSRELAAFSPRHVGAVSALALSPSGTLAASGDLTGEVRFWDLTAKTPAATPSLALGYQITDLAFTSAQTLIIGTHGGETSEWDLRTRPALTRVRQWSGSLFSLSADGRVLATSAGGYDSWVEKTGLIRVWSPRTAAEPWVLPVEGQWTALSPDGRYLAVVGAPSGLSLWDVTTRRQLPVHFQNQGRVWRPVFSEDGRTLAACSSSGAVWWTVPTPAELAQADRQGLPTATAVLNLPGTNLAHPLGLWRVQFLPSAVSGTLITACEDRVLRGWDLSERGSVSPRFVMPGNPEEIWSLALARDGRQILTGVKTGSVHLWPGELSASAITVPSQYYQPLRFSPDGRTFITLGQPQPPAALWQLHPHASPDKIKDLTGGHALGFSADPVAQSYWVIFGSPLALHGLSLADPPQTLHRWPITGTSAYQIGLSSDRTAAYIVDTERHAQVIRLADGVTLGHFQLPNTIISRVALSAQGTYLATGSSDEPDSIQLVHVATGKRRGLRGHQHMVNGLAFSPDATRLATVASDTKLKIWHTATGVEEFSTAAHLVQASDVAWSPDGRTLATLSVGEGFKLWHATTHRELVWWPHRRAHSTITFSPDGRWLALSLSPAPGHTLQEHQLIPIPQMPE